MTTPTCPYDHEQAQELLLPLTTGDPVPSEIAAHLEQCPVCRTRLDELRSEVSTLQRLVRSGSLAVSQASPPAAPARERLAVISHYRILGVLGSGSAEVYRAVHSILGQDVVLRLGPTPINKTQPHYQVLVAEGKALARLDHPNLARVYNLEFFQDRPCLVMEYVRGRNLERYVEEERPNPQQAASLVARLARALAEAHRQGVCHRDIKPRNVLIDATDQPHLIDFGVVRLTDVGSRTPEPEMAGERGDVFSLGGVLHYLLTGRADLDRGALQAAAVPRLLQAICLRVLAVDPAARYARADELAADLERFGRQRGRRFWLTRWMPAAALVCAGVGGVVWFWPSSSAVTVEPDLEVGVWRAGRRHDLAQAVPLKNGDELQVRVQVHTGYHASLFRYTAQGKLLPLTLEPDTSSEHHLLYYPGPGKKRVFPSGPGTELLLVCIRRSEPVDAAEITKFFKSRWKALPANTLLLIDQHKVRLQTAGAPETSGERASSELLTRAEALRRDLAGLCDAVVGVVFAAP